MRRLALAAFCALAWLAIPASAGPPRNFIMFEMLRPVPAIEFADGEGRNHTLADFRGKVVLLNIWATWCPPCRKEMPTLDRLQAKIGGSDFEVVALSVDRTGADVVQKFFAEIGIRHLSPFVDTSSTALQKLAIFGLPTTLLIDREGQELGRLIGPAEWDDPEAIAFVKDIIARQAGASSSTLQKENDP